VQIKNNNVSLTNEKEDKNRNFRSHWETVLEFLKRRWLPAVCRRCEIRSGTLLTFDIRYL